MWKYLRVRDFGYIRVLDQIEKEKVRFACASCKHFVPRKALRTLLGGFLVALIRNVLYRLRFTEV